MQNSPIIVALDFEQQQAALELVSQLDPRLCRLKVGKEMFTHFGPDFVKQLHQRGFDVFLDLKFHDIPNTVAKAVKAAADLGVWMVNVHASGGSRMITSMEQSDLSELGISLSPAEQVLKLATLTQQAGLDGVVCSAHEAALLKTKFGKNFQLVTPGIRPSFAAADDQKRVMSPSEAVLAGVDYMVIGRPITKATDPLAALHAIYQELNLSIIAE